MRRCIVGWLLVVERARAAPPSLEPRVPPWCRIAMNTSSASASRAAEKYEVDARELRQLARAVARHRQNALAWIGAAGAMSMYVEFALASGSKNIGGWMFGALALALAVSLAGALRARTALLHAALEARTSSDALAARVPRVVVPRLFESCEDEPIYLQGRS